MRVARPKWTPQTDDQRRAIAAVVRAAKAADAADGKLWDAVAAAHALGVPPAHIAEKSGRGRNTIYRHLPPPQDGDS